MADYSAVYTLATPGPDIVFNNGSVGPGASDDVFWISTINGLDAPTLRGAPVIDLPFGSGGLASRSWEGFLHPAPEGSIIVQSASGAACQDIFTGMEADLRQALAAIVAPASGTLSWTDSEGAHSLTVYQEVPVVFQPTDNYRTRSFSFGLATTAYTY